MAVSGRIFDRVRPGVLLVAGFRPLVIDVWQPARPRADKQVAYPRSG